MPDPTKGSAQIDMVALAQAMIGGGSRPSLVRAQSVAARTQGSTLVVPATGDGADWMGPENPISPQAPREVIGRQFDFPVGYNLATRPRAFEPVSFAEMRALADNHDVLHTVIQTRKDQMSRLTWAIKPKTLSNGEPAGSANDDVIAEITDFFSKPNDEQDWDTWLSAILDDLFVIDAVSIYRHRTAAGKLLALEPMDGATFKRVLDDYGRTPAFPAPAYQQILKGLPAVNYTTEDLIYRPRNRRTWRVYGCSPVEQIIATVNTGIRRQLFTLQYFSDGNMPEGLVGTPDNWTPEQIATFQQVWDALLTGDNGARRRLKFVPGGVAKTFVALKEPELSGKFDEWIARVVCFAFSISPTPFIQQVNRATAESAHDAAIEEGLAPIQNWVKRLIDEEIGRSWPKANVEFAWNDDRDVDPTAQQTVAVGYVSNGIKTINEVRDELGLDPMEGGDKLLVKTATGYVPVDAPEPEPQPISAPGVAHVGPDGKPVQPEPGKPAVTPKPDKEAQAAKAAGPFRKGDWWDARPSNHAHARASGGRKSREAADAQPDEGATNGR